MLSFSDKQTGGLKLPVKLRFYPVNYYAVSKQLSFSKQNLQEWSIVKSWMHVELFSGFSFRSFVELPKFLLLVKTITWIVSN